MTTPYLVLSRKYRPQIFSEVIYQELPVSALLNAIKHNKIGHAYLFHGARGTGKTSIARIFAKSLNCSSPINFEPCNECSNCSEIKNSIANDVIEIDAASHRGIDKMREIIENVKFTPMSGKYKIYIIDEAHMLTGEAYNALLKTLEEPPRHVVIILATTEYHKIPETILSRCQDFSFKKVPLNVLEDFLKKVSQKENIKFDSEGLFWIAKLGDGSVRDSLSIMEQAIVYTDFNLIGSKIRDMIGYRGVKDFIQLTSAIINTPNSKDAIKFIHALYLAGEDFLKFIWDYIEFLHTAIMIKDNIADKENISFPIEDINSITEFVKDIDNETTSFICREIYKVYEKIQPLKFKNIFEIKVYFELSVRNIISDLKKPTLSGVLEQILDLNNHLQKDIVKLESQNSIKSELKTSSPNPKLEDVIKEKFTGTEVDSKSIPRID